MHSPTIPIAKKAAKLSSNLPFAHMENKPSTLIRHECGQTATATACLLSVNSVYSYVTMQTHITITCIHTPKHANTCFCTCTQQPTYPQATAPPAVLNVVGPAAF